VPLECVVCGLCVECVVCAVCVECVGGHKLPSRWRSEVLKMRHGNISVEYTECSRPACLGLGFRVVGFGVWV
jgi:hypothetical protein